MENGNNELEALWEALLSRHEKMILQAFNTLDHHEQQTILDHLKLMVSEPDWQPEQVTSARVALETLTSKN